MQTRSFIGFRCVKIVRCHFNHGSQSPLVISYHLITKNPSHGKEQEFQRLLFLEEFQIVKKPLNLHNNPYPPNKRNCTPKQSTRKSYNLPNPMQNISQLILQETLLTLTNIILYYSSSSLSIKNNNDCFVI